MRSNYRYHYHWPSIAIDLHGVATIVCQVKRAERLVVVPLLAHGSNIYRRETPEQSPRIVYRS